MLRWGQPRGLRPEVCVCVRARARLAVVLRAEQ